MSERTVVHLLRHGEVENPGKILYGRLPGFHLSALGRKMADRAAETLAGRDVRAVIASPLERAVETAAPVAAVFGLQLTMDERLIESANVFEGLTVGVGDGSLRSPRHWWYLRNPLRPSWGEPYVQVAARLHAAVDDVRRRVAGHEAVVVSHQLPIWVARLAAEHRPLWHDPRRRECSLASLTSFEYEGDQLTAVAYSEPAADLLPGAQRTAGA
jgi:broad specificity phosphatase PhoE